MNQVLCSNIIDGVISGAIQNDHDSSADVGSLFVRCFGTKVFEELFLEEFTELMINADEGVYLERQGRLIKLDMALDIKDINRFIDEVSQINSRNIDFSHPIFDGKLPGSYRCNIVVPPVSLKGPLVTLRRHIRRMDSFTSLIGTGMLSSRTSQVLAQAIFEKKNIIISGGTGTGKTTLVNVLFNSLSEKGLDERVITIEDTAELNIKLGHVLMLESRFPTPDCPFEISIRDLVKTALRMRPDRIVVGEVRGEEAYDLLHAINTGHKGTVCTIHANSCRDALRRLETLAILGHPNLDVSVPRTWIASNVDMVVYIERVSSLRKVSQVQRVIGSEAGNYVLEDII